MKKITSLIALSLFCATSMVFAETASVLPARVGRLYVANTYAFANGAYDTDGKYEKFEDGQGAIKAYNLGFALEYGITDWITAAVQWAPGWNVWSEVDMDITSSGLPAPFDKTGNTSEINVNDLYDIFLGAKVLIVGEKAPVVNSQFRFAVAPGVLIPTPGPDADTQLDNLDKDDPVTFAADNHAWGIGGRVYLDYIVNKMFYMNLFSEYIQFFEVETEEVVPQAPALGMPNTTVKTKYNYGYQLKLEAEPNFEMMVADGVRFGAGLPVTYTMTPDYKIDGDKVKDSGTSVLTLGPSASVFLMKTPLPLEFKLGYTFPVYGVNTSATNSVTLQAKAYFKL